MVLVSSGGMYAQRLRDDDPEYLDGDYSPTTAYAEQARAGRAAPDPAAALGAGRRRRARHAPGWADTPGVQDSLPTFRRVTGPLLRDAAGGADTTIWLAASQPAPAGGLFWHDRRPRPTQLLPSTRTGESERQRMWSWVQSRTGLVAG